MVRLFLAHLHMVMGRCIKDVSLHTPVGISLRHVHIQPGNVSLMTPDNWARGGKLHATA